MRVALIAILASICSGCAVTPYYPMNAQVIIRAPVMIQQQPIVVYRPPVIIYQPPVYHGHYHRHR